MAGLKRVNVLGVFCGEILCGNRRKSRRLAFAKYQEGLLEPHDFDNSLKGIDNSISKWMENLIQFLFGRGFYELEVLTNMCRGKVPTNEAELDVSFASNVLNMRVPKQVKGGVNASILAHINGIKWRVIKIIYRQV